MIDLVHALGLEAVAEGVETAGQFERLRAMGCDMAQRHYFSRSFPATQLRCCLNRCFVPILRPAAGLGDLLRKDPRVKNPRYRRPIRRGIIARSSNLVRE
jgi:hypothetical protein